MNKLIQSKWLLAGIMIFLLSYVSIVIFQINSKSYTESVTTGILLDLLITFPIFYLFVIWKRQIPKFTVAYVFLLGLFIAKFTLPNSLQIAISQIQYFAIPLIEIGILTIVLFKIKALKKAFQNIEQYDFFEKAKFACQEVFPNRIGIILATEISMFYYLFNFSKISINKSVHFTYYKKSGIKMILSVFLILIVVETAVVHLLISNWNENIAWALTILSIYTLIQIIAILNSMDKRPIFIDYKLKTLNLKYGIGCQSKIKFDEIKSINKYSSKRKENVNHIFLSLFDLLDTNNVTLELKNENILYKLYGIEKKYESISLYIDEKEKFIDAIEKIIKIESSRAGK